MPPIDPRRIAPPQTTAPGLPMGSMPVGTRANDPFAATKVGYEGQRVGFEGQRVGISAAQEAREAALFADKRRKEKADADKAIADAKKAAEEARKAATEAKFREPVDELLNVVEAAANAHKMTRQGGLASDPWGRAIGSYIPGTGARDISGYNDTIKANTAFKTLQQMRSESPTGGAVGNVSDADMKLLASTIASLDMARSTEKYQESLQNVLNAYKKVLLKLPGGKDVYHAWRLNWLGYDPSKRKGSAEYKGGVSDDVQSILDKYGVK